MKLLIVTQKLDRLDPILGFFHRWIAEFARHCARVTVIPQSVRDYRLPQNVAVYSLGKEESVPRLIQIFRFWSLLWKRRGDYDVALIHMTPVWAVIGWPLFLLTRKPVYLWYEARGARWPLRLSLWFVEKVFSASASGMPVTTRKSVITGHGIDTEQFSPRSEHRESSLAITVGRMTASKQLPVILNALAELPSQFHLQIVGSPLTPADRILYTQLQRDLHTRGLTDRVRIGSMPQQEVVALLQHAMVFLHASMTSLDKALLEAMACGCLVVSCAEAARGILPTECLATPDGMAERVQALLALPVDEQEALRRRLRDIVVRDHGLERLIKRLVEEMA